MSDSNSKNKPSNIGRRQFLKRMAIGIGAVSFSNWQLMNAMPLSAVSKAKSVIFIWLAGGPSHLDTFDPKPKAGKDYSGPYRKPVATTVDDVFIGQKLPLLAQQARKFTIIRSMTHGHFGHETASYVMQTGTLPGGQLVYPSMGAVISYKKEGVYQGNIPPYISLTSHSKRFNEGGFLGPQYKSFATGGDPNKADFVVEGLGKQSINPNHLHDKKALLKSIDSFSKKMEQESLINELSIYQEQAFSLITGDAKKAFDLSSESEKTKSRYGNTTLGQSCLLARKLAEQKVPFITVRSGGWDTHKLHFERMEEKLPELDKGLSALLEDLDQRGMLEETLVVCGGEFGRTPKVLWEPPWNGGRGHFGAAFSYLVAGGGFKGGEVYGKTNLRGESIIENPVYPWDLTATIYHQLGINPKGTLPHPRGGLAYVLPEINHNKSSNGILTNILK
ncbi:DUF1501 domain-containing protein [Labilibacter sediminis]|nr:DUF1501 domain-containing protein [Labilibacter sediminis]